MSLSSNAWSSEMEHKHVKIYQHVAKNLSTAFDLNSFKEFRPNAVLNLIECTKKK